MSVGRGEVGGMFMMHDIVVHTRHCECIPDTISPLQLQEQIQRLEVRNEELQRAVDMQKRIVTQVGVLCVCSLSP